MFPQLDLFLQLLETQPYPFQRRVGHFESRVVTAPFVRLVELAAERVRRVHVPGGRPDDANVVTPAAPVQTRG